MEVYLFISSPFYPRVDSGYEFILDAYLEGDKNLELLLDCRFI